MERLMIKEIPEWVGSTIKLQGWIYRLRNLSRVCFLLLRDRTGIIQVVLDPKEISSLNLTTESVVEIIGEVKLDPRAKSGYEIVGKQVVVLSRAQELPFPVNTPSLTIPFDTMLNHRVLSLRHDKIQSIFKIQSALAAGFQAFLMGKGFIQIFTPKIVGSGTEGGTELFELQYIERKAFLAQSPQFYKQMMVGAGYERVFEIAPVFRAEPHATSRHLNEYISLDLEMGFIRDENDVMDLENEMLRFMFDYIQKKCSDELECLGVQIPDVHTIPRLTFTKTLEILEKEYGKKGLLYDLDPEGERLICDYIYKKTKSNSVFITGYPRDKRPMYTMPLGKDLTHSFDLLFRGVEVTTGGQRIHQYKLLVSSMKQRGLDPEGFAHYLEVFKSGMPPHGGLAIGLERLTAQLLGLKNIREASLFPRDRYRLNP